MRSSQASASFISLNDSSNEDCCEQLGLEFFVESYGEISEVVGGGAASLLEFFFSRRLCSFFVDSLACVACTSIGQHFTVRSRL